MTVRGQPVVFFPSSQLGESAVSLGLDGGVSIGLGWPTGPLDVDGAGGVGIRGIVDGVVGVGALTV